MGSLRFDRLFHGDSDAELKDKLSAAAKRIELHRRELESIRSRLEFRRQSLFETTVRAIEHRDESRATVYANEHGEIKKVMKVVAVSELALTQIIVRLESIRDVGDVIYHISQAFRIIKKVSKTVSGLVPALETASQEINSTLTETLVELSNISPNISISPQTDGAEQLMEKARKYAEEKAAELKEELPTSILNASGETILEKTKNLALLATGDDYEEEFPPALLSRPKPKEFLEKIYQYITEHNGDINVLQASAALQLPIDDVEQAILKLVSEGRIRLGKAPAR